MDSKEFHGYGQMSATCMVCEARLVDPAESFEVALCSICRLALQEVDRRLQEAFLSGGVSAQQIAMLASTEVN
jgi:NMD protein affecting ribosome stability and mRNA decay